MKNQIDYIMIKRMWRTTLQDVKTRPSADCGSDHQMLLGRLKLRLKSEKTTAQPVRFDVMNIPAQFVTEIGIRLHATSTTGRRRCEARSAVGKDIICT